MSESVILDYRWSAKGGMKASEGALTYMSAEELTTMVKLEEITQEGELETAKATLDDLHQALVSMENGLNELAKPDKCANYIKQLGGAGPSTAHELETQVNNGDTSAIDCVMACKEFMERQVKENISVRSPYQSLYH